VNKSVINKKTDMSVVCDPTTHVRDIYSAWVSAQQTICCADAQGESVFLMPWLHVE